MEAFPSKTYERKLLFPLFNRLKLHLRYEVGLLLVKSEYLWNLLIRQNYRVSYSIPLTLLIIFHFLKIQKGIYLQLFFFGVVNFLKKHDMYFLFLRLSMHGRQYMIFPRKNVCIYL